MDDKDVDNFIEVEENTNTKKKTELNVELVKSFIAKENERRPIEKSPQELDSHLSRFILAVRKKNGDKYEPTTLRRFISSVDRYLKKFRYSKSIITRQNFITVRNRKH